MARKVSATTANVLVCFQTRPGIDSSSIIEGGKAKVKLGDVEKEISPQGDSKKGFYGLKLAANAEAELSIFNIKYKIKNHITAGAEAKPNRFYITCWKNLGVKSTLSGKQRRLQMLGYYTGKVDGVNSELTERAVLGFQADNKMRTDGQNGHISTDKTKDKINSIIAKNKDKDGKCYVACRTLVGFARAPKTDPDKTAGDPEKEAPEIDDRGSIKVKTCDIDLYGPVVSMARNSDFRVKVIRQALSDTAPLKATSDDTSLVEVKSTLPLPNKTNMILNLKTKDPGTNPKSTAIRIKLQRDTGDLEIASIQLIVLPLIKKEIRPYWVTINGASHTVNSVNFSGALPPVGTKTDMEKVFKVANRILWPYGIEFEFLAWRERKSVTLSNAGQITWSKVNEEFKKIATSKAADEQSCEDDKLNLFIVRRIDSALGITYSTLYYPGQWPLTGIAMGNINEPGNLTIVAKAITLAHELGHFMGLSDFFNKPIRFHAEDDPNKSNKKKDIWSIRKIMYGEWPKSARPSDSWAHDIGYGDGQPGCMISLRNLADKTDDECRLARKHASSSSFYK